MSAFVNLPQRPWITLKVKPAATSRAEAGNACVSISVVDSFTRESLALEVDTSMPSRRITRAL
jgi:hypothetical protein